MNDVRIDIGAFQAAFFEEADEHLGTIESGLLELGVDPKDREVLGRVFRAAHSIKGAAGTFGFPAITDFTHALETLLDHLRDGTLVASAATVALLLRGNDALRGLLSAARAGEPMPEVAELRAALLEAAEGKVETQRSPAPLVTIQFRPNAELFLRGMDPLLVVRDAVALGESDVEVTLDTTLLPALEEMSPETSYLAWTIRMRTAKSDDEIRDVFAFVESDSDITIVRCAAGSAAVVAPTQQAPSPEPLSPLSAPLSAPLSEALSSRALSALSQRGASHASSTLRVSSEKLDRLIDLLGELVIAQSMVTAAVDDLSPEGVRRLREALAQMDRNTRELQDRVLSIRMVPIGTVFRRFTRVIHDIAAQTGKKIRLELEGEETEIDKGMVEVLADPLMHLVRNAADHGIEMPEDRSLAGKSPEGVVRLRAMHQGGNVVVELSDDGRGIQTEKVREKARKLGLIGDEPMSPEQIHQLIFAPGFSTASNVTEISGRGVGMDVVKRNVEAASGSISFTSEVGKGSTMRVKLPLTMAIMDGLTLRVGEQRFVVPLSVITETFRPTPDQVVPIFGAGEVARVRGEPVPLVRIHRELAISPAETDPTKALLFVVETATGRAAILVDEVLGQAQVVVNSLETSYRRVDGITGATILGDGRVALILDVPALVQRATQSARERSAA